jgi:predicted Zn-dependent peptidase
MAAILQPGGSAVVVVGNVTLNGVESLTTQHMSRWAADAGLSLERELPKIVWGLYNVVKDEKILFFRKDI